MAANIELKRVQVESLVREFITDGWNNIPNIPNIPAFALDTTFTLEYIPPGETEYLVTVVKLGNETKITGKSSFKSVQFDGPFIDYILQTRTGLLPDKMVQLATAILETMRRGWSQSTQNFLTKYGHGFLAGTIRHAVGLDNYKLEFHRNSVNIPGAGKGIIVSAIYINRPNIIQNNSGGIRFVSSRGNRTIIPQPGNMVTFYNTRVIHKVISPVIRSNVNRRARVSNGTIKVSRNGHQYVFRTAIFINIVASRAKLNANRLPKKYNKPGLLVNYRNTLNVTPVISEYFKTISNQLGVNTQNTNVLKRHITNSTNANVTRAMNRANFLIRPQLRNKVPASRYSNLKTVPQLFVHLPHKNMGELSRKEQLLKFLKVYNNILKSFKMKPVRPKTNNKLFYTKV